MNEINQMNQIEPRSQFFYKAKQIVESLVTVTLLKINPL